MVALSFNIGNLFSQVWVVHIIYILANLIFCQGTVSNHLTFINSSDHSNISYIRLRVTRIVGSKSLTFFPCLEVHQVLNFMLIHDLVALEPMKLTEFLFSSPAFNLQLWLLGWFCLWSQSSGGFDNILITSSFFNELLNVIENNKKIKIEEERLPRSQG